MLRNDFDNQNPNAMGLLQEYGLPIGLSMLARGQGGDQPPGNMFSDISTIMSDAQRRKMERDKMAEQKRQFEINKALEQQRIAISRGNLGLAEQQMAMAQAQQDAYNKAGGAYRDYLSSQTQPNPDLVNFQPEMETVSVGANQNIPMQDMAQVGAINFEIPSQESIDRLFQVAQPQPKFDKNLIDMAYNLVRTGQATNVSQALKMLEPKEDDTKLFLREFSTLPAAEKEALLADPNVGPRIRDLFTRRFQSEGSDIGDQAQISEVPEQYKNQSDLVMPKSVTQKEAPTLNSQLLLNNKMIGKQLQNRSEAALAFEKFLLDGRPEIAKIFSDAFKYNALYGRSKNWLEKFSINQPEEYANYLVAKNSVQQLIGNGIRFLEAMGVSAEAQREANKLTAILDDIGASPESAQKAFNKSMSLLSKVSDGVINSSEPAHKGVRRRLAGLPELKGNYINDQILNSGSSSIDWEFVNGNLVRRK